MTARPARRAAVGRSRRGRRCGSGRRRRPRPGSPRRSTAAERPGTSSETAAPASPLDGPASSWSITRAACALAGTLGTYRTSPTASCRVGSTNQARTVRKSSRKIDSGTTTPSGSREIRHWPSRRTTSTSHWNGDCAGSNAPAWVSRPIWVPRMRIVVAPVDESGAPGAGTVSIWPSSTVTPVVSSHFAASGARNARAAACLSVLLPEAVTKSRTRSSGLLPSTGPARWRGLVAADLAQHLHRRAVRHARAPGQAQHGEGTRPAGGSCAERVAGTLLSRTGSSRTPGRDAVAHGRPAQRRGRDGRADPARGCPAPARAAAGWTPARRRRRGAASAGTPHPCPARPTPAASRRAGGRPRRRSTAPARCRRCAAPATPRPARSG